MLEQFVQACFMAIGAFGFLGMCAFFWHCTDFWSDWPIYLGRFATIGWLASLCCLLFCAILA